MSFTLRALLIVPELIILSNESDALFLFFNLIDKDFKEYFTQILFFKNLTTFVLNLHL